ncbi:MAG: metallophosphoesterase [Chloroflexia bacterium]|nr:metallophosphoesterase [Chloroflexia bacterium]
MPPPLRIAHLADTHLGYRALGRTEPGGYRNQRSVDIETAFERVVDSLLGREVDLVLHAGDVFHHTRPSWTTLGVFVRHMRRIEEAGIPALVIAGNHDTPRLRQSGSVSDLLALALPKIRFVAGYELEEVPFPELELVVHAVPHGALVNPDPAFVLPVPGRRNIVVTHGLAAGVQTRGHEPGEERLAPDLLDPGADYVALGHFHLGGQPTRNAWYSGSTERMGWGDEEATPGYNLVTLDEAGAVAVEHVPIPARPMKTLAAIDGEGLLARELADIVLDRAAAFGDPTAMVRLELRGVPRQTRREVEGIVRREVGDRVWDLRVYTAADLLERFAEGRDEALPPLKELFARFVDEGQQQGIYDDRFAALFRERGSRALDEAQRQAAERSPDEGTAA